MPRKPCVRGASWAVEVMSGSRVAFVIELRNGVPNNATGAMLLGSSNGKPGGHPALPQDLKTPEPQDLAAKAESSGNPKPHPALPQDPKTPRPQDLVETRRGAPAANTAIPVRNTKTPRRPNGRASSKPYANAGKPSKGKRRMTSDFDGRLMAEGGRLL